MQGGNRGKKAQRVEPFDLIEAELIRFYGFSLDEVREMNCEDAIRLYNVKGTLWAKEQLNLVTALTHPRRKRDKQKSYIRQLKREANKYEEKETLTIEQIVNRMNNNNG